MIYVFDNYIACFNYYKAVWTRVKLAVTSASRHFRDLAKKKRQNKNEQIS